MSTGSREVVHEGWLIKSPPTKRILRARWRRRWFTLRHSGELPGQFFLEYYTDRNCRKLKGRIDLDQCEQVDAGLHFEQRKLKYPYMFDVKTPNRVYYLAADSEVDMNNWVDCICQVCGLKAYSNDENDLNVGVENLPPPNEGLALETPPLSPASGISGPYIPISECVTGRPLTATIANQHIQLLLQQELYDSPRVLSGHGGCTPPLQSPTDSESVFTDDEWSHPVPPSINGIQRTSVDSGSCNESVEPWAVTQRFGKLAVDDETAPPRPPKPTKLGPRQPSYLNLAKMDCQTKDSDTDTSSQVITSDTMYDFPRSHQVESEGRTPATRHCYNNAAPGEGHVFRYDVAAVYENMGRPEDGVAEEPPSPASQSSITYSNLPSPAPLVNRTLKPGRKLSDSASISSLAEPPSPRPAPTIDRTLKPTAPPRKTVNEVGEVIPRNTAHRAAPSPIPPGLGVFDDDIENNDQIYIYQGGFDKLQYLDLDLDGDTSGTINGAGVSSTVPRSPDSLTVYHQVDFIKTEAFMRTRQCVEAQRKQCSVEP